MLNMLKMLKMLKNEHVLVKNLSYGKIDSVNPLYLIIDKTNGYIEENTSSY